MPSSKAQFHLHCRALALWPRSSPCCLAPVFTAVLTGTLLSPGVCCLPVAPDPVLSACVWEYADIFRALWKTKETRLCPAWFPHIQLLLEAPALKLGPGSRESGRKSRRPSSFPFLLCGGWGQHFAQVHWGHLYALSQLPGFHPQQPALKGLLWKSSQSPLHLQA